MTDERISDERLAEMLAIDLERASFDLSDEDDIIAALRELQARRAAEAWRPTEWVEPTARVWADNRP